MPVVFSNPALLLGALAGAIPVIIHFLSLRKVQRQPFSDLRFLTEVQARQARSLGIRRWILLLLRVLAILLIAFAVAGPHWGGLISQAQGDPSVLFVIDTSASMNTQTEQGVRLERAVVACRRLMESLPASTTVQVITAGSQTRPLFGDWLPSGAGAVQGLALVTPSDGAFDVAAVLREASVQVARAPAAEVQMVWLSDLQAQELAETVTLAAETLTRTGRVQHLVRPVGTAVAGGGVHAVNLPRRAVHQGENITLTAQVKASFDEETFVLELDGQPVAEAVVPRAEDQEVTVSFDLAVPEPGLHRGLVRKASDQFPEDDQRPFALQVPEALEVLVVHGRDRAIDGAAGRGGWRFLEQALAPGGDDQLLKVRAVESGSLTTGDLAGCQVVYFVDPDPLGRRVLEGTLAWLRAGGAACFLLGEPVQGGYYASSLLPALGLPGDLEDVGGGQNGPQDQRPRIIDPDHPIFAGLGDEALGTVGDIPWRRWFRIAEGKAGVLAALTDDSPLIVHQELGEGRVAVLPWHLAPSSSGLAASPMALPLFQRLTLWLGGRGGLAAAGNIVAGQQARVVPLQSGNRDLLERTEDLMVWQPGEQGRVLAELVWKNTTAHLVGPVIDRAGFVTFVAGPDTVGLVAVAVPVEESSLTLWSADQWRLAMESRGLPVAAQLPAGGADDLSGLLAGRALAPWLFLAAILVLLLELFVGRGTTRPAPISG